MPITHHVHLDPDLVFTYADEPLSDTDTLSIIAPSGAEVSLQLNAPMKFEASHDEKGKTLAWKVVTVDTGYALAWSFPCPRSPFTLKVSTTDTTAGAAATTSKAKKVRIEAGASGTAKGRDVAAPAEAGGGKPHGK